MSELDSNGFPVSRTYFIETGNMISIISTALAMFIVYMKASWDTLYINIKDFSFDLACALFFLILLLIPCTYRIKTTHYGIEAKLLFLTLRRIKYESIVCLEFIKIERILPSLSELIRWRNEGPDIKRSIIYKNKKGKQKKFKVESIRHIDNLIQLIKERNPDIFIVEERK